MQSTINFADVELRIMPHQPEGYLVEISLNGEQEFAGAFLQPQEWSTSLFAIGDGRPTC